MSKKKVYRKFENKINKIVIDFSQDNTEFQNFIKIYNILKKINISIPKIYEVYFNENIIVMEDFGDQTFNSMFREDNLYNLLKLAIDNLIIIQNSLAQDDLVDLERYNYSILKQEISEFIDYYLPYKKISNFPVNDFYSSWEKVFNNQYFDFTSFVHKDFEFINLILLNKNNSHFKCGIIDFQNAFLGFKGWDLFSILENPRMSFTNKFNEELIKYFYDNVTNSTEFNIFRNQYYILNLSRQTRLLGRWVKLFTLGHQEYLNYIDTTKKRILLSLINVEDNNLKKIYRNFLIN